MIIDKVEDIECGDLLIQFKESEYVSHKTFIDPMYSIISGHPTKKEQSAKDALCALYGYYGGEAVEARSITLFIFDGCQPAIIPRNTDGWTHEVITQGQLNCGLVKVVRGGIDKKD